MAPVVRIAYGESRTTKLSKRAWELQPGEEDDTVRSNRASSSWVAGAVRGLSTMASGTPRTSAADALAGDSDLSAKASGIRPRVPPRKR
ncbi:MAG: hypothetical protein HY815_02345 [Candidatus Riflebacteria bacterium]|nr:hypothetical protein [Candidatus Riflebacteria bacterium]